MKFNSTLDYINYITDQYSLYSGLFNIIVGLIGHSFLIIIFTKVKAFRGNQCTFYLTVESSSNIGLLIMIYSSIFIRRIFGFDPVLISLAWCKSRTMFAQIFGLCSVYTIFSMTMDQYLATNCRYSFRKMSSLKLAYRLTLIIICFCTLHSIVFLTFSQIDELITGCTVYNPIMRKYLSYFYYPVVCNGLPTICTIIMSVLAYRNVRRIIRRHITIVRRRLDRQLTAMVLARVVCAVTLAFPFLCTTVYELNLNTNDGNTIALSVATSVGAVTYALLYTNFSISFYVFLANSSRFRHQVKRFLIKQWEHFVESCCYATTAHPNNNQVMPEYVNGSGLVIESVD